MRMREETLASPLYGPAISDLLPIVQEGGWDSAALDNVFRVLVQ
jgi:glutamate synthase domain-containing protein 1